jgi:hypothetical protein
MHKKRLIEYILLIIFLTSGICAFFKVPFSPWLVLLSGFLLGSLYFYFAFWLFAEFSIPLITRFLGGLFYSVCICACMFCFLNWPLWQLYSIISCVGLALIITICLFNNKKTGYKQLLYRCFLFIVVISIVYSYKLFR